MNEPALFDYTALDDVRQLRDEIKERVKRTIQDLIGVGERLILAKERLGHGRFLDWLRAEFDWSERTARNLMAVTVAFKSATVADLAIDLKALYALAAPSVPPEVRELAIEKATNGHHVTHTEARAMIAAAAPPVPQPLPDQDGFDFRGDDDGPGEDEDLDERVYDESEDEDEPDGSDVENEPIPVAEPVGDDLDGAISTLRAVMFGIRRRGGVLALTRHWTPDQRRRTGNLLARTRDEIAGYVAALLEGHP